MELKGHEVQEAQLRSKHGGHRVLEQGWLTSSGPMAALTHGYPTEGCMIKWDGRGEKMDVAKTEH